MKLPKIFLLLGLFLPIRVLAQTTVVSGTITDSASTPYANGSLTISFVNTTGQQALLNGSSVFQQLYSAQLDSTGSFSVALPSNTSFTPPGTQWNFFYASVGGYGGNSVAISIIGSSQSVTSNLSGLVRISWPSGRVPPPGGNGQSIMSIGNGLSAWGTPASVSGGTVVSPLVNSVVVLTPATSGTHWTDKLVTAYGTAQCASGCTIEIPDSVADNGSATTATIPSNVNLQFTGSANFTVCTINAGQYGFISLGNATLTLSGSNCTGISQTNTPTLQTSQKWVVSGGQINCNSQVGATGIFVGNHTGTVIKDTAITGCLDTTSTAGTPTAGLVCFGCQFDEFDNLKLYNNYVGMKIYGLSAAGGGQSNTFNDLTVVGAGTSATPVGVILFEQGSTFSNGPNYFNNLTIQSESVAGMAIFGDISQFQTLTYIHGGAPEANGGGAATVSIDGKTVKQASTYVNFGYLYYVDVQMVEATINPVLFGENSSKLILVNPDGYGNSSGQFTETDSTSNTYITGTNTVIAGATFGNLVFDTSGPTFNQTSPTFGLQTYTTAVANSPTIHLSGSYQNSGTPTFAKEDLTLQTSIPAGTNPFVTYTWNRSGSSGGNSMSFANLGQVNFANGGFWSASSVNTGTTGITVGGNSFFTANLNFRAALQLGASTVLWVSNTAPTIAASGCGTAAASIPHANGTAAFTVNIGTTNSGTCTITMPSASNGWACQATNLTTKNANQATVLETSASTASSLVLQNYTDVMGTHAMTDSDILSVQCGAY